MDSHETAVIIGVIVLVALSLANRAVEWGDGWVWPVPDITDNGTVYAALISHGYERGHWGVDIMFRRGHEYFAPAGTPILAAKAGIVWSVNHTARGTGVVISHSKPFATFYQHLESSSVKPGDAVDAGTVIGTMGIDPTDAGRVRHLHFAVWYAGSGDASSVDPSQAMRNWRRA